MAVPEGNTKGGKEGFDFGQFGEPAPKTKDEKGGFEFLSMLESKQDPTTVEKPTGATEDDFGFMFGEKKKEEPQAKQEGKKEGEQNWDFDFNNIPSQASTGLIANKTTGMETKPKPTKPMNLINALKMNKEQNQPKTQFKPPSQSVDFLSQNVKKTEELSFLKGVDFQKKGNLANLAEDPFAEFSEVKQAEPKLGGLKAAPKSNPFSRPQSHLPSQTQAQNYGSFSNPQKIPGQEYTPSEPFPQIDLFSVPTAPHSQAQAQIQGPTHSFNPNYPPQHQQHSPFPPNPINPINPISNPPQLNPLNTMNPIHPIHAMNAMNQRNPINTMNQMNPINQMNAMNRTNPMTGMEAHTGQNRGAMEASSHSTNPFNIFAHPKPSDGNTQPQTASFNLQKQNDDFFANLLDQ